MYIIDQQAQITSFLLHGNFCDTCLTPDGILYALEFNGGQVIAFKKTGTEWRIHDETTLQNYQNDNTKNNSIRNTMVIKERHIYVSIVSAHRIISYDMAGNKVKELGYFLSGFQYPRICGIDRKNTLLIANCDHQRLDWLDDHGTRTQQSGFGSVYPWYAVYQNEATLWVLDSESRLHKYSFD